MVDKVKECFKELTDSNLPQTIYLDTSVLIHAFTPKSEFYVECQTFLENIKKCQSELVFSNMLYPELWCAVIKTTIKGNFKEAKNPTDYAKAHPRYIREYFQKALKIEKRLKEHKYSTVPVEKDVIDKARIIMPQYKVGSADAIHIATAEILGILDVACVDKDWENLPSHTDKIRIWCEKKAYQKFIKRNPIFKNIDLSK